MDDGDRLAPISLAGEYPVTQLVVDSLLTDALLLDHHGSFLLQDCGLHPVPVSGIDHGAAGLGIGLCHVFDLFPILRDDLDNGKIKLLRELEVTVVVGRDAHDGAGTVICQYIIGKPDRDLLLIQGIDGVGSGKDARFLLILQTVYIGLHGGVVDIFVYSFPGLGRCQRGCQLMLRRKHHEGRAVQSIRPGGIDRDLLFSSLDGELHLCAVGFSDPVGLHFLYFFRPVKLVQIIQQPVRVFGDLQHPLTEVFLGHRSAAAFAAAVHDLLVGETGLAGGTPVDGEFLLIGKPFPEHLHEDPLGPFIEIRIRGIDFHIPVVDRRDVVDLFLDILNVLRGGDSGMNAHLDRVILCRKTECVPAHGMDQIVALKHFVTAPDIRDHIASPVPHMESVSGWIWKHVQTIIFRFFSIVYVNRILFPVHTPFGFYGFMIVWYGHFFILLPVSSHL